MMQHTRPEHRVRANRDWRVNAVVITWAVIATLILGHAVLSPR